MLDKNIPGHERFTGPAKTQGKELMNSGITGRRATVDAAETTVLRVMRVLEPKVPENVGDADDLPSYDTSMDQAA